MYSFLKLLSHLPLSVLYAFTYLIYLVSFYLIRWRRDVATGNLKRAFPEKSEKERYEIMRRNMYSLSLVGAEAIWAFSQSREEIASRVLLSNAELATKFISEGKSVMLTAGHCCNWEWMHFSISSRFDFPMATVYKKQRVEGIDRFLKEARGHFGDTIMVPNGEYAKEMITHRRQARAYAMVADQTPTRREPKYWSTFLGQESAFFVGADKFARVLKAPVIYPKMRRVGRGRYVVTLELIAEPPYPKEDDFAITEGYIRHLEADILEEPSNWLWVHKKWKYRRSASKGGTEVSGVGAGKKPKEASSDQ